MKRFLAVAALLLASSCGPTYVANEQVTLEDGQSVSFKVTHGRHNVEVTSSGDGVTVEFVGAACPKTPESRVISTLCDFSGRGQIIVSNPTSLGLGASVVASVTISVE